MKLFRALIPNLAICLNLVLLIVIYLDMRNPMMGFMEDTPFYTLAISAAIASLISAVTLYGSYRKNQKNQNNSENYPD